MLPEALDHLPARELRKLEVFAAEALRASNPNAPPVPDTIEQIREKKQRIADREAVIKGRGYALADEK